MFCPKCGNNCSDGAKFCNKCGADLSNRSTKQTQGAAKGMPRTLPIIPIVAVIAVVLVAGIGFALTRPKPSADPAKPAQEQSSSTMTEGTANRISPKESIKVSDLKIKEDEVKRYVVTGKVANTSNETYDATIKFSATRHSSDKYGEETTKKESLSIQASVTPFTTARYNSLVAYDLAPGEERTFSIYPDFSSIEEALSDPTCEVTEASLSDAHTNWRFDHDKSINITSQKITPDGKAVIEFVNNTNMYLNETEVTFVCYNKQDIPAVASTSGARPSGAVVKATSADTLKPGDKGTFETKVGEGFSKVEILHVSITPDPNKNSFN